MSEFKTDQDFELKIFDCCIFDSKNTKKFWKARTHQALKSLKTDFKKLSKEDMELEQEREV
jgi:hypothetical protein